MPVIGADRDIYEKSSDLSFPDDNFFINMSSLYDMHAWYFKVI